MLKFGEGRVSVSGSVQFGHPRENRAVWEARCEGKWVSGPGDLLGPEGTVFQVQFFLHSFPLEMPTVL